jgi:hypothetical protein
VFNATSIPLLVDSSIAYLEMFAVFWALSLWAYKYAGYSLPIWVDNTNAESWLKKLTGPLECTDLMDAIMLIVHKFDIRLLPNYITSKANYLADYASRGMMTEYRRAFREWLALDPMDKDNEDWMLAPDKFTWLDVMFGPFNLSACCDDLGANSHTLEFWSPFRSCLLRSWSGLCIFCNPPFSLALRVMLHFLKCKIENSVGTAALFILPVWKEYDPIRLVLDMPRTFVHVITWKAKTMGMFTSKPSPQE